MDKLEQQLEEIKSLIKGLKLISPPQMPNLASPKGVGMPTPEVPKIPGTPSLAPKTKKNPIDVAHQIKAKDTKKLAVNQAREFMKTDANGQWTLESV